MKCGEVIQILESLAPTRYACSWDNVGLLLGRRDKNVHKILAALDVTDRVLEEVEEGGYDMLVTHHPIIFRPITRVNDNDYLGRWMLQLLSRDISCYAMHTNFDIAPGGMADLASKRLELRAERPLEIMVTEGETPLGIGKIGTLADPCTIRELCDRVKETFQIPFVTMYTANADRPARRIAICPGSGKGMTKLAEENECDVLISGDFGHHDGMDAVAAGVSLINAGHYGLEHIFPEFITGYLREHLGGRVQVDAADVFCPEELM